MCLVTIDAANDDHDFADSYPSLREVVTIDDDGPQHSPADDDADHAYTVMDPVFSLHDDEEFDDYGVATDGKCLSRGTGN